MNHGSQTPLQEGQELVGILDTEDDLLEEDDDESEGHGVATHADDPAVAPWDQLIAAVDREFLPHDGGAAWTAPRFRGK